MPTVSRKSAVQQLLAKCKGMKTLIKETSIPVNQGGVNYKSEDIVHYFINVFIPLHFANNCWTAEFLDTVGMTGK